MQTYVSIVVIAKSAGTWYYDNLNIFISASNEPSQPADFGPCLQWGVDFKNRE